MPDGGAAKRLSLDSNVLLDLADELNEAHEFREHLQARKYGLFIPPLVLAELHDLSLYGSTESRRMLAADALTAIRPWKLTPFNLSLPALKAAFEFSTRLIQGRLLPASERNDGQILGQCSLAQIPVLATRDRHLLDIDRDALSAEFLRAGLPLALPMHPRDLLRVLR